MLNNRLLAVAGYIPPQAKVFDVGCDHAYLPIYLIQNQLAATVIAGDIVSGPVAAARKNIARFGLSDRISVIQTNGLCGIQPGSVDCVIIAGMGATTIIDILTSGREVVAQCKRIIMQPMVGSELLRYFLTSHGFTICREELCLDNNRLYEIISAEPTGTVRELDALSAHIGLLSQHELFGLHLRNLITRQTHLIEALRNAKDQQSVAAKLQQAQLLLQQLQEVSNEST